MLLFAGGQTESMEDFIDEVRLLILAPAHDASVLQPRRQSHGVHLG